MSSADVPPCPAPRSLRTRLAVAHVAVAGLVVLVGGAWLSLAGLRYFQNLDRRDQLRMLRELKWEYLAGAEIPGPVPKEDITRLPAPAAENLPAPPVMVVRLPAAPDGTHGGWAAIIPAPGAPGAFLEYRLRADGSPAAPPSPCRTGDLAFLSYVVAEKSFDNGPHAVQVLLLAPDGTELLRSSRDPARLDAIAAAARSGRTTFRVRAADDDGHPRSSHVYVALLPDGASIALGADLAHESRFLGKTALQLLLALLVALLPALLAARWFSGRVVRAVSSVSGAARAIASGDLRRRVPPSRYASELGELGDAFNAMCDANERLVAELRTLSDDIAHDLRTPLTRLRGASELVVTGAAPADALPAEVAEETGAMLDLIDTMLEISRAGFSIDRAPREIIDLATEARRVCDLYAATAEERGIALETDLPSAAVPFRGHCGRIQQLLGNLLDNALKFTPRGGRVALALRVEDGTARLEVADTGPGVPEGEREIVFRRFWRGDASRTLPGNGLGLALVRAVATAYGGSALCLANPGGGARFVVTLPL